MVILGGDAALLALKSAMGARQLRLVLDATLNHTSANHPWMNRWGRHPHPGAWQSPDAPTRSAYVFDEQGHYRGWNGQAALPVLDYASPLVRTAMFEGRDSMLRHWLRPPWSIDGWRFDVMNMIGEGGHAFNNALLVAAIRRAVKEENPEAWVLGEHFNEATRWLQGDQEDSAMNYFGFAQPLRAWLARRDISYHPIELDARGCERWLTAARARIPFDNQLAQLNLLGSHDTARFLTLLDGNVAKMKLAVAMLFTYPGVPSIYYGDEIGLEGGRDPDSRRCFEWDRSRWNEDLFAWYRALAALRTRRRELQEGAYQTLTVTDSALAWARYTPEASTLMVANGGGATTLTLPVWQLPLAPGPWVNTVTGERHQAGPEGRLEVRLAAQSVVVLESL